jgi:hypothetical protein
MFQRDKDLRAAGGADRSRVLEKAKEQRQARAEQREREIAAQRLQTFVRTRLAVRRARDEQRRDFDAKVADIGRLKTMLQRETLPLPFDVIFDLTRKLLFCYSGRSGDQARLAALSQLFRDALAGQPADAVTDAQLSAARKWQLVWLVNLCLQASKSDPRGAPIALALQLTEAVGFVRSHVVSQTWRVFSPLEWQYARMEQLSLMEMVRRLLSPAATETVSRGASADTSNQFSSQLVAFAIHAMTQSSALETAFVEMVLGYNTLSRVFPLSYSAVYSLPRCSAYHCYRTWSTTHRC